MQKHMHGSAFGCLRVVYLRASFSLDSLSECVCVAVCVSYPGSCPLALRCSGCWIIMRQRKGWVCPDLHSTATTCCTVRSKSWSPSTRHPSENSSVRCSWGWGPDAWAHEGIPNITTMDCGSKRAHLCSVWWRTSNTWPWGSSPSPRNRGWSQYRRWRESLTECRQDLDNNSSSSRARVCRTSAPRSSSTSSF